MRTLFLWPIKFLVMTAFAACLGSIHAKAQSISDLHSGYEQYWKEDIGWLEKINHEPDGHKAAALVDGRRQEMLPKYEKLLNATTEAKKNASDAEQKKEKEWAISNTWQRKDADMQTDLMINASAKGQEFGKAVGEYMKAMMTIARRVKK